MKSIKKIMIITLCSLVMTVIVSNVLNARFFDVASKLNIVFPSDGGWFPVIASNNVKPGIGKYY